MCVCMCVCTVEDSPLDLGDREIRRGPPHAIKWDEIK